MIENTAARKTLAGALQHRLGLAILIVCVFVIGGVLAVVKTPSIYEARATLFVDVRQEDATLRQSDGLLSAEFVQQATSHTVLERAIQNLKLQGASADSVPKRVRAEVAKGAPQIIITAQASDGRSAAALATAVASALIDVHGSDVRQLSQQTQQYLKDELARLDDAIRKLGSPAAGSAEMTQLTRLENQYATTYGHLQDIDLAQTRTIDSLVLQQAAQAPLKRTKPDPIRYLAVALLAGMAVSGLVVLLLERFDDRLPNVASLAQATRAPLVLDGALAYAGPAASSPYALLRAGLLARHPAASTILVVLLSESGAGKTIVSQLESGGSAKTTLADEPAAHSNGTSNRAGIGQRALVAAVSSRNGKDAERNSLTSIKFDLTTAGGTDRGISTYKPQRTRRRALTILPVASPTRSAEVFVLGAVGAVAILVATAWQTEFAEAQRAADMLRQAGIEVAGGILLPKPARGLAVAGKTGS